ncbi:galactose oxidase [Backusella circina FSU 941]|nr:galactose oxidase [Backusella circina FSU 941]
MPATMQMQSISGIITQIHGTTEDVPPALVGASVNVIGDKVFVFAGRLSSSRKMTNYLHVLDLNTLSWTRHIPPPDSDKPPQPRYFHSASVYDNQLVFFGGMGYSGEASDTLCVLDDVSVLDIETMCWKQPVIQPSIFSPQSRYAHLSSVTDDKLIIIGGQDIDNNYLDEMNVLNCKTWEWEQVKPVEKHVGAYRSVAVSSPPGTCFPSMLKNNNMNEANNDDSIDGTFDNQYDSGNIAPASSATHRTSTVRQYGPSSIQTVDEPNPIYLYTNYNFTDVKRELQLIYSSSLVQQQAVIEDCSSYMNGSAMPPGLRFPTGHTLGNHLILAGTYLSPQSQSYSIWSLDLGKLTWSRIETGNVFSSGSWNKGVLCEKTNRFIVFGNSNRNLLDDYNHRQINFDHVAMVDLEAFGVYALPKLTCSSLAQEMGLRLLNEPAVSDFHIITQDNQSIPVNSAVLCQRWPYFASLMKENHKVINPPTSKRSSQQSETKKESEDSIIDPMQHQEEKQEKEEGSDDQDDDGNKKEIQEKEEEESITVIRSHFMSFPYPHAVVIALLQFIYTDNLLTAQQYQPHILSQLLLLSDMYDIPRLRELSTHALHQMLNMSTAPLIFETAALSHQTSLQIRALKMMIAAKKMIQQQQQLQQQQQQQIRSRTVSTPVANSSADVDAVPPISPTTSLSSSSFSTNTNISMLENNISRMSIYDQQNLQQASVQSPTLSSFRTRKPSIGNSNSRTFNTSNHTSAAARASIAALGNNNNSKYTTDSPPITPRQQKSYPPSEIESVSESPRRPSSPPPSSSLADQPKEKKKKKAFLDVFGKFSSSFQ